jgi:hypothetical protein
MIGFLVGGGAVQMFHTVRDQRDRTKHDERTKMDREIFKQRLTCKDLAEAYLKGKANESDNLVAVVANLNRVDFSPARNSCIASTSGGRYYRNQTLLDYAVVDLMSHETLFEGSCNQTNTQASNFCGNGKDMELSAKRDKEFDAAMQRHP